MVYPLGIELLEWAAQLVIDFPQSNIPLIFDESVWKEWGNHLIQSVPFATEQMPDTAAYEDWQEWALQMYYTMSNYA